MTFGLRNAGATFQRCMQKCLLKQLGRNAHVYVDDVVVKTEKRGTLLEDLKETFENLRRFQIKLNPEKCVFGVPAGQLLGFLVSERGIECNPVKIKAIERMEVPSRLMKRLMDARQPVNFWTSRSRVGTSILSMALILTGLHSMPRSETRKPSSWPAGTPNTHFSGLSLI